MVRHDNRYLHELVRCATQTAQRNLGREERLGGEAPDGTDRFRRYELDLPTKIRPTARDFISQRIAVPGGAALEHVADEHLVAPETDGAQHLV